jgi:fructose-1,6-bisphosphatase I
MLSNISNMVLKEEGPAPQSPVLLREFLEKEQNDHRFPIFLVDVFKAMARASKLIQAAIINAALDDRYEQASHLNFNPSGDRQQVLDIVAQNILKDAVADIEPICGIVSEESEAFIPLHSTGDYVLALDPIDGSANLMVHAPVGTLFSIYQLPKGHKNGRQPGDLLLPGSQQIAAGYMLYSTVIVFVYSTPAGVHAFTYNPTIDDFVLTHPHIRMSQSGAVYAINYGYLNNFPYYVQNYIAHCNRQECSGRYTGALVADFHRNLLGGGIYLYPPTYKRPHGKLRLLFECNTLAFIACHADGLASSGRQDILEVVPRHLHQCAPLYIGSALMVRTLLSHIKDEHADGLKTIG